MTDTSWNKMYSRLSRSIDALHSPLPSSSRRSEFVHALIEIDDKMTTIDGDHNIHHNEQDVNMLISQLEQQILLEHLCN